MGMTYKIRKEDFFKKKEKKKEKKREESKEESKESERA
jgi:hypothetical protein